MNSKRTYYLMIATLALLIIAIFGGTYFANLQLKKQADKLVEYKSQNQVLTQEQVGLTKAKKDVATYSSLEIIAKTVVPQDKDQAKAVREIVNIAAASGIKPTAINFPVSTLGGAAGVSSTPSNASSGSSSSKQSLSYVLPITIQLDATSAVPYAKFIDFLGRLEQNRRTAQVSSILLQPSATNHDLVSFTLIVDEFIKP